MEIPVGEIHLPGFQLGGIVGKFRTEHHGILDIGVNNSDAQKLKTMLDSRGATRPEPAHMIGLLAGLGNVAWINGDGHALHPILKPVGGKTHIVAEPVKVARRRLSVALLATPAISAELGKINLSVDAHD